MTEPQDFLDRATDPTQYDSPELYWDQEGFGDSPVRIFLWEHIKPMLGDLQGSKVLDVGTGTAWLPFRMEHELGAEDITALEPSNTQRQLAQKFNPNQSIQPVGLMDFETTQTFDIITASMVFEHIYDLDGAFDRLRQLTHQGSRLAIVMADKDTFLRPRADYHIERQDVDADTVAIRAMRTYGLLHDIVRPVAKLVGAAEQHGFRLDQHQPLVPDEMLQREVSRYSEWQDQPICHLVVFDRL